MEELLVLPRVEQGPFSWRPLAAAEVLLLRRRTLTLEDGTFRRTLALERRTTPKIGAPHGGKNAKIEPSPSRR